MDLEFIDNVLTRTLELYKNKYYHLFTPNEKTYVVNTDLNFTNTIENIIFDNGLMYLTDFMDYAELWASLVISHPDNKDTFQYNLLNLTSMFRGKCFTSIEDYSKWVDHILDTISINTSLPTGKPINLEPSKGNKVYVTLEDVDFERLHKRDEMKHILEENAWVVFLFTLSMCVDEIISIKNSSKTIGEMNQLIEELNKPTTKPSKSKLLLDATEAVETTNG